VQAPDGLQFRPRGRDVHRDERGEVEAGGRVATMEDEIALDRAGRDARPFAPRPQWDLGADRRQGGSQAARLPRAAPPERAQEAVERRRAGGEQRGPNGRAEREGVMPLERREQRGEHRGEEFAAEVVTGLPDAGEDGDELRPVPLRTPRRARAGRRGLTKPSDGGLAMTAGRAAVLVEDLSPPTLIRGGVSCLQR